MRYFEALRNLLSWLGGIFAERTLELQPKDILTKLFQEMERRKKFGIEEKAYVPNVYMIYLCPFDFEEISPLLSGIKEQLKNKLVDRVKKKGYKVLSSSVGLEIRDDSGLVKSQIVIESSFVKEKFSSGVVMNGGDGTEGLEKKNKPVSQPHGVSRAAVCRTDTTRQVARHPRNPFETGPAATRSPEARINRDTSERSGNTKVVEDKATKLIDLNRVRLEVVKGDGLGEIIALREGEYTFGRGSEAEYLLKDTEDKVSRLHFKLIIRGDRTKIKDLSSLNGTRVNDIEIEEAELQKGDLISAGNLLLKVA